MLMGIDTSNYTTSIAIIENNHIICDFRRQIKVGQGKKGIRQSDAFFQHMQTLKTWLDENLGLYSKSLKGIGVSIKPRPIDNSYMPVFMAGETIGITVSKALGLPLIRCSHQEGHLFSALHLLPRVGDAFIFLHLSGGTTEAHAVSMFNKNLTKFNLIASTADISLGQLVDRIGVMCELPFPCGAHMDSLAQPFNHTLNPPKFRVKTDFNLSGYENYFKKLHQDNLPCEALFYHIFEVISNILIDIILFSIKQSRLNTVVIAGGVAANTVIRDKILKSHKLSKYNLLFSDIQYASDNALGVAKIAQVHI